MKFFAICTLAIFIASAYAEQTKNSSIGFGARAAFDFGLMYGFDNEDDDVDGSPKGIGFEFGLMAKIAMIPNLYFAPEVNFSYINTSHKYNSLERKYKSMDLEIPLLIRGIVFKDFYVTAGPQLNICINDDADIEIQNLDIPGININANDIGYKENIEERIFTFGLAAGVGYNIFNNLFVDFRYYIGFMELYPDVDYIGDVEDYTTGASMIDMSGAKMMKFKIGLSYWFF